MSAADGRAAPASTPGSAAELEPVTGRAWRPAQEAALGGWRLTATDGFSGRVNACWPLGEPDRPLDQAIAAVEAWYRDQGRPVFKLAGDATRPRDLADRLAARGYRAYTDTVVMTGPVLGEADPLVRIVADLDPAFAAVFAAAGNGDPADARERLQTLERMPHPRGLARLDRDGAPVAIGAVAVEGPWAGIFAMRTDPAHRRLGLAWRVFQALLAHAAAQGARHGYLQVEAGNDPALALYARAGFAEAYRYCYWTPA
ncbi:GNAT family N-acetyltransferase [Caulobacter sp. KR2-114]|uniref:GNAT family N-acetyltransferase n=1 Tax=Caulobacter sp. KR2-114 TaxID=3400912 RepID=UPI003BFF1D4C